MKVTCTHIYRYGLTFVFWPILMFKKLLTETHKNQFNLDYDVWQKFINKKNCSKVPLLEMDGQFIHYIFSTSLSIGMGEHF